MTDPLISAVTHLQQTSDHADARAVLAQAALAGADPKALRAAWEEWRRFQAASVTRLYTSDAMRSA